MLAALACSCKDKLIRLAFLQPIFLMVLLTGCSAAAKLPGRNCIDLSGEYLFLPRERGQLGRSQQELNNLGYRFLWEVFTCETCHVDKIVVRQLDCAQINVKPVANGHALSELWFSVDEASESELVVRSLRREYRNEIALTVKERVRASMSVTSTGDLRLTEINRKFAWILFIPWWSTESFDIELPRIRR